ncbi:hypothetical protein AB0J55_00585 [Amycolatopsis sp. NPDC049688]|uniref:hypothetical protein n=1 Tax=Amycolatopsis sp. NPDC049688 TaxID=3154733 RepID=UPI00341BC927
MIATTNRDEEVFTDPDRFDLHRDLHTHLGFGTGPHYCPAHLLVTALARTALEVLFERLPGTRPPAGPPWLEAAAAGTARSGVEPEIAPLRLAGV